MNKWLICLALTTLLVMACSGKKDENDLGNAQRKGSAMADEMKLAPDKQFLLDNSKKEGVAQTASGLQYKVIIEGSGARPSSTDRVKVHYRGSLIDGTQFDSSYDRGEPLTFGLNQVIRGWTEGLQLMSIGSKYELYIPSELGYGARGAGAQIPPGATLIFEVELLDII